MCVCLSLYTHTHMYISKFVYMLVSKNSNTGEKGYFAAQQARLLTTCPSSLLSSLRIFFPSEVTLGGRRILQRCYE